VFCELAMAAVALQDTSQRGTILVSTQRFEVGDVVFEEDALFDSSPSLKPDRAELVSELFRLSRKGMLGGFSVAQHLAAIVVAESLSLSDLRSKVLSKYHAPPTAEAIRLAKLALKGVAKAGLLPKVFAACPELWRLYAHLLAVIAVNCFCSSYAGADDGSEDMGLMLFDLTSRMNHACSPNVAQSLDRNVTGVSHIQLVATRAIDVGDELNISYLYGGKNERFLVVERQQVLFRAWGFHCQCERCSEELAAAKGKAVVACTVEDLGAEDPDEVMYRQLLEQGVFEE